MKKGVTFGAFDLLHPGHCIFLAECAKRCDQLYVGLHVDPSIERSYKAKPIQTTYERYIQLVYHKGVYHVMPYDTEADLVNILTSMPFDVRFVGADYLNSSIVGEALCPIEYIDRQHSWSSTELRDRIGSICNCGSCSCKL